jgi:hypothetical protein
MLRSSSHWTCSSFQRCAVVLDVCFRECIYHRVEVCHVICYVFRIQILYFKLMFALLSAVVEMRLQERLCPLWGNWRVLVWAIDIKERDQ